MKETYLVKTGVFIDGNADRAQQNVSFLVEEGKIAKVGAGLPAPDGCKVLDYSGKTVMPGMINAHTHIGFVSPFDGGETPNETDITIAALHELHKMLKAGVTYIRVCAGNGTPYLDLHLRNAMRRGAVKGPNIMAAGRGITMTGGAGHYCEIECDSPDETRKAARFVLKQGVDFIKIVSTGSITTPGIFPGNPQLNKEELEAAIIEAHKAGKTVATHAHGSAGIRNALAAGIDSIEHGSFLCEDEKLIETMIKQGTWLVPTLSAPYFLVERGKRGEIPAYQYDKSVATAPSWYKSFTMAHKAGVKIAMGSDCFGGTILHEDTWHEVRLMAEYGMTNMEAIQASTRNCAQLMQIADTHGTLEPGKAADFIVLENNPLDDICALEHVWKVYKDGEEQ